MPPPGEPDTALALVHRGWDHLRLQRPLAAWACWQRALRISPEDRAAIEALAILDSAADLPLAARTGCRFRSPENDERRARWSALFAGRDLQDLAVASEAFALLAEGDPEDGAARYNEALCLAWRGENRDAIEALDRAVRAEAELAPEAAVASWTLAEVLRQGAGAEDLADDLSHAFTLEWPEADGDPIAWLATFAALRPVPVPIDPATGKPALVAVRVFEWLDHPPKDALPRVRASVVAAPGSLRLSSPDLVSLEAAEVLLRAELGDRPTRFDRRSTPLPLRLMDAAVWLFRLPEDMTDQAELSGLRRSAVESYFEQTWIAQPRLGLSGAGDEDGPPLTPVGASRLFGRGDSVARAKLTAVVNVREQLATRPRMAALYDGYPFDRLRRRLSLAPNNPAAFEADDVTCMGREDLDRLDPKSLSDSALAEAIVSARSVCDPPTLARYLAERHERGSATEEPAP